MTRKEPKLLPLRDLGSCLPLAARLIWFLHNTRHPQGSEHVHWAFHSLAATLQDMRIDHRGPDILMTEEFLDRKNVVAVVEEVRSERVAGPQPCSPLRAEPHSAPEETLYSEVHGCQILFPDWSQEC